jgi:hypothetical protein
MLGTIVSGAVLAVGAVLGGVISDATAQTRDDRRAGLANDYNLTGARPVADMRTTVGASVCNGLSSIVYGLKHLARADCVAEATLVANRAWIDPYSLMRCDGARK